MDVGWNSIAISLGRKRVEGENSREEIYTIKLCTGGGDVLIERTFELQLLLNSSSKIFLFLFPVYLKEACDLDNLDLRGKRFLFSLSLSIPRFLFKRSLESHVYYLSYVDFPFYFPRLSRETDDRRRLDTIPSKEHGRIARPWRR